MLQSLVIGDNVGSFKFFQSPQQSRAEKIEKARLNLRSICERVETGDIVSTKEKRAYSSLAYFYDCDGNDGAIDEFLNMAEAAGLL